MKSVFVRRDFFYCTYVLFVGTRHEEECSLLILVEAMHFLKHCPLVSVANK